MSHEEDETDGALDESSTVVCPYCGAPAEIALDPAGGAVQDYVEDCQTCCQPWQIHVRWRRNGQAVVDVSTTDG